MEEMKRRIAMLLCEIYDIRPSTANELLLFIDEKVKELDKNDD